MCRRLAEAHGQDPDEFVLAGKVHQWCDICAEFFRKLLAERQVHHALGG
jgi:hypothetical protein